MERNFNFFLLNVRPARPQTEPRKNDLCIFLSDQINMDVFFLNLVKNDMSSVRYCTTSTLSYTKCRKNCNFFAIQPDKINMAAFFWNLVKSDFPVHVTALQGTLSNNKFREIAKFCVIVPSYIKETLAV